MSYYTYAEKYPPCLVRLLARHKGGPPLTTEQISESMVKHWYTHGGNPRMTLSIQPFSGYVVNAISQELTWNNIEFGAMRAFLAACECDFTDFKTMDRKDAYMRVKFKTAKFDFLHRSPEWETVLQPLVLRYRQFLSEKIK